MSKTETKEPNKSNCERGASTRSAGSYGATNEPHRRILRRGSSGLRRQSQSDPRFTKRTSFTATTDKVFERRSSKISSLASGKSLSSAKLRTTSVSRSEYHEDLKPQLSANVNRNLILATFVVAFGESFLFGWNIGVLNQPATLIKEFYSDVYGNRTGEPVSIDSNTIVVLWSLTNALFIPGGMCGAVLGGAVADKFGRKRGIMFSHIFTAIGAVLSCVCVVARAPELLMVGRVFVGINNGLGNCLAPMFLTEIAPFNLRGALGTVHQLSITLGILLSSIFGIEAILGTPNGWPFLILLELLPAAITCAVLPFLPETPRYLLLCKGLRKEAETSLKFYRQGDDVLTELEEMDTEQIQHKLSKQEVFGVKDFFKDKRLVKPLIIACLLQVVQQFSGINAVFFYSSNIFKIAGVSDSQIPFTVIGTNAVNVAMTIITVPIIDKAGRRPLLIFPMGVMILDLVVIILSLHFQPSHSWLAYVIIICIIVYVIGFAVGLGPIPMMIGSELFRQGPRATAMSIAGITNWICTFVIALGFEPVNNVLQEYTFIIFLGVMVVSLLLIYFFVPETKGRTFEEIAHQFAPGDELEVEEVFDEEDDVFGPEVDGVDATLQSPNEDGDATEDHSLVTINFGGKRTKADEDSIAEECNEKTVINMEEKGDC